VRQSFVSNRHHGRYVNRGLCTELCSPGDDWYSVFGWQNPDDARFASESDMGSCSSDVRSYSDNGHQSPASLVLTGPMANIPSPGVVIDYCGT